MKEIIITNEKPTCEYFCNGCGQLRLSFDKDRDPLKCGNCGSMKLVIGEIEGLDKDYLKRKWERKLSMKEIKF